MNIGKKTLLMVLANGFQQISTVILIGLFSRRLTQGQYATYSQGDLIVKTLLPILVIGIPISVSYFISKTSTLKEEKTITFNSLLVLFITGVLGVLLLTVSKNMIVEQYQNDNLGNVIPLISIYLFFEVIASLTPNFLLSTNQNRKLAKYTIVTSVLKVFLLIIVYFSSKSLKLLFWGLCFVAFTKFIFLMWQLNRRYRGTNFNFQVKLFKLQLIYAMTIGLSQLIGKFSDLLDKNMISMSFSPKDYAIFANGTIEIPFIGLVGGSIASVLLPEFSKKMSLNSSVESDLVILNQWKKSVIYTAAIIIPIMFTLLMFSDGYIEFLFSSKYLGSKRIFQIYLFKMPVGIATYSTLILAKGKNKLILINSIISLIINFILNLVLINVSGMLGAAIATVISFYILAGLQIFQISKILKISFNSVIPFKKVIGIIIVGLATTIIFSPINQSIIMNNILRLLILGPIFYLTNLVILHYVKIIDFSLIYYLIIDKKKESSNLLK